MLFSNFDRVEFQAMLLLGDNLKEIIQGYLQDWSKIRGQMPD